MAIRKMFLRWLIGWMILMGIIAIANGSNLITLLFGYSFLALGLAFSSTIVHFGIREVFSDKK